MEQAPILDGHHGMGWIIAMGSRLTTPTGPCFWSPGTWFFCAWDWQAWRVVRVWLQPGAQIMEMGNMAAGGQTGKCEFCILDSRPRLTPALVWPGAMVYD